MAIGIDDVVGGRGTSAEAREAIRRHVGVADGELTVSREPFPFSAIAYNTALLPPVLSYGYLGRDRKRSFKRFVSGLRKADADVVGLCEVFLDSEKSDFARELGYPHDSRGPSKGDKLSNGGLSLLARDVKYAHKPLRYRRWAGNDKHAAKGALGARIRVGTDAHADVFMTHAQDIEPSGGEAALRAQLRQLGGWVATRRDWRFPCLVMGDLNFPDDHPGFDRAVLHALGRPVDLWHAKNPSWWGNTTDKLNDFTRYASDRAKKDLRLDYALLHPGTSCVPIVSRCDLLYWTSRYGRHDRDISDHFGLRVVFKQCYRVRYTLGTPTKLRVSVPRVWPHGAALDDLRLRVRVVDRDGTVGPGGWRRFGRVSGVSTRIANPPAVSLGRAPRSPLRVEIDWRRGPRGPVRQTRLTVSMKHLRLFRGRSCGLRAYALRGGDFSADVVFDVD